MREREHDETRRSETPLHLAAYLGHLAVARLLLQSRADTTSKDQWNDTAAGVRSTGRTRRGCDASGPSGGGWRPSVKTLTTEIFLSIFPVCVATRNGILGLVGHPIFKPFRVAVRDKSGICASPAGSEAVHDGDPRPQTSGEKVSRIFVSLPRALRTRHTMQQCCLHCSCSFVPHCRWLPIRDAGHVEQGAKVHNRVRVFNLRLDTP